MYRQRDVVLNLENKFDEPANSFIFVSLFGQSGNVPGKLEDATERMKAI